MYAEEGKLYYGLDTERHNVDMSGTVPVKYNSASVKSLEERIAAETSETYTTSASTTVSATYTTTVTTTKKPTTTATTTVTTTVTTTTFPPEKKGDVDGDGQKNAVDASLILSHYARISTGGRAEFNREQQLAADVDGNGLIDAVDASCILSYYAFLSTHTETLSIDAYLDRQRLQ